MVVFQHFVSLESLPDPQGGWWSWTVGSHLHLQGLPDARHTCGKVEGPLSPCGVGQTPQKGLVDEMRIRRPGFWSRAR